MNTALLPSPPLSPAPFVVWFCPPPPFIVFFLRSLCVLLLAAYPDYIDTVRKVTQWERPTMRVHSTGGVGVQAVDTPMVRTRRSSASSSVSASSTSSSAPVRAPAAEIPPTAARRRPDSVHPSLGDTPASSVGRPETTTSFEMQETRTGHVVDKPLPPGWEVRTSADGKKCEWANGPPDACTYRRGSVFFV